MKARKLIVIFGAMMALGITTVYAQDRIASTGKTYGNRLVGYDSVDDYFNDQGYTKPQRRLATSERALAFLIELSPLGGLSSPDMEGFETSRTVGLTTETESIDNSGSYMPTVHFGLGINNRVVDIDILAGGGSVSNSAFGASFAEIAIAPRFRFGDHFRMGPFISAMSFGDAEWRGDSDIEILGGSGSRVGMSMCVGSQKAYFKTTMSYADFNFDVDDSSSTWSGNRQSIDMSGWALQMGVYFRF